MPINRNHVLLGALAVGCIAVCAFLYSLARIDVDTIPAADTTPIAVPAPVYAFEADVERLALNLAGANAAITLLEERLAKLEAAKAAKASTKKR